MLEQVGLDLKNDPLIRIEDNEANEKDLMNVPPGSFALAQVLCGQDDMPIQVLAMIRSRSMEMAKQLGGAPNEEKSFELADPINIPLPPPGEVPFIDVYKPSVLFNVVDPPPLEQRERSFGLGYPSQCSSSSSSFLSTSFSSAGSAGVSGSLECSLCACVDGEDIQEEASELPPKAEMSSAEPIGVLIPTPGQVFVKKDVSSPSAVKPVPPSVPSVPSKTQVQVLECKHMICKECFTRQLATGWTGARASFNYLNCGMCGQQIRSSNTILTTMLTTHLALKKQVEELALSKFDEEGVSLVEELVQKGKLPQKHTKAQRMEVASVTMAIYKCVDCSEIFCGGRVSCAEEMDHDPKNMRCQACVWSRLARETDHRCMQHGFKFAIFKCDSCCSVATWDCGWNHFCERCHGEAQKSKNYRCPGPDKCPLGMPHPKNLEANFSASSDKSFIIPFVIGCMACVGYTAENPGCSRPSPAEMQWEVKKDPIKGAEFEKRKMEAQKEEAEAQKKRLEERAKKAAEERAPREAEAARLKQAHKVRWEQEVKIKENEQKAAELRLKNQEQEAVKAVGECSEAKCKCKCFQPQKWQVNKCHKCFHWAKSHV